MTRSSYRLYAAAGILLIAAVVAPVLIMIRFKNVTDPERPYESIRRGDLSAIERYLAAGGDPNARVTVPNGEEWRLLRVAVVDREEDVALALLRAGADLESTELPLGGKTPLDYWFEVDATVDKARVLHELVVGGADACRLVPQADDLGLFVRDRLRNSAPQCWPEEE